MAKSATFIIEMATELGTTLERQKPSGELRQFLDPLNPGIYFDHGPARLYGIDEVLELEAKRRGRILGDDEFQLVATDGGLIFCRASICFAIAARWRDLTLGRPAERADGSGRVDLPVDWPAHGQLTFTVSPRLGSNIYRRWLHVKEQDGRRSQVADGPSDDAGPAGDPDDSSTIVLDNEAKMSMVEDLTPVSVVPDAGRDADPDIDLADVEGELDPTADDVYEAVDDDGGLGVVDEATRNGFEPRPWTEPGLELAGGETLFVEPERGTPDEDFHAMSTVDPAQLVAAGRIEPPSVEVEALDEIEPLTPIDVDIADVDSADVGLDDVAADEDGADPSDVLGDVEAPIDPNQTIRRPANFDVAGIGSLESLGDDAAVSDSVFALESPMPAANDGSRAAGVGPGIRDSDGELGSFREPIPSAGEGAPMEVRSSRSGGYTRGLSGNSAVDGDTTLAEIWHRNKVSILAGASLIVLLIVALSSLLGRDDAGTEVDAGADEDVEITIPDRSDSISLPAGDESGTTSTTEPRAPLVIEGLTTAVAGESGTVGSTVAGAAGEVGADSTEPANDGQSGDVAICHSNYGGCVPVAADVDCVGDGDGPAFLSEPVVVFGEDVYDLDTDDDREACELGQPLSTPPVADG